MLSIENSEKIVIFFISFKFCILFKRQLIYIYILHFIILFTHSIYEVMFKGYINQHFKIFRNQILRI